MIVGIIITLVILIVLGVGGYLLYKYGTQFVQNLTPDIPQPPLPSPDIPIPISENKDENDNDNEKFWDESPKEI